MFVALMAALLVNVDFGHQPAKVLCVVRQVIEIRGVEVEDLASLILRRVAGIEDHVERFTATQRD
jgi:hypothetical protein